MKRRNEEIQDNEQLQSQHWYPPDRLVCRAWWVRPKVASSRGFWGNNVGFSVP
jgi:hypothetical protein